MELGCGAVKEISFIPTWVRTWLREQLFCNGHCWIAGEYCKFLMASEEDFDKN